MIAASAVNFCNFQTKFMEIFHVAWKNLPEFAYVR